MKWFAITTRRPFIIYTARAAVHIIRAQLDTQTAVAVIKLVSAGAILTSNIIACITSGLLYLRSAVLLGTCRNPLLIRRRNQQTCDYNLKGHITSLSRGYIYRLHITQRFLIENKDILLMEPPSWISIVVILSDSCFHIFS